MTTSGCVQSDQRVGLDVLPATTVRCRRCTAIARLERELGVLLLRLTDRRLNHADRHRLARRADATARRLEHARETVWRAQEDRCRGFAR